MQIMLDPLNNKIHVFYIYFFDYDHVKDIYHLGNHVGDIEQTNIVFENGEPVEITADYHSWYTTLPWGDPQIEMFGNHPVVYNARGTHSTWFTAGIQRYAVVLYDVTAQGQRWDLWESLEVIFPWDYLTEDKIIKGDDIMGSW